jgi:hypothetical protein
MLLTWRAWHARNQATHDKTLPSTEGSVNFLCGYLFYFIIMGHRNTMGMGGSTKVEWHVNY